jgi:DNA (cytosine-5)-methyltransferase 1
MRMMHTAISLFSGAGGMDVGFRRAGFRIVWANELNKHAAASHAANHPEATLFCADLNDTLDHLPPAGQVDCVFGGPPCQGFSVAGKMEATDPRSKLVFAFMEVVGRTKPRAFVLENVRALAQLGKFEPIRRALLAKADALGYRAELLVLNSKDFGVPQSRERMFLIGFERTAAYAFGAWRLARYRATPRTMQSIFDECGPSGTERNPSTCRAKVTLAARPILRKSPYAGMLFNGLGRPIKPDGLSCTLPASMGGNKTPIVDEAVVFERAPSWVEEYHKHLMNGGAPFGMDDAPRSLRRLTLKEAALIQSFPDGYMFKGPQSSIYSQIGNAVPCMLAEAVASAVADSLEHRHAGDRVVIEPFANLELALQ